MTIGSESILCLTQKLNAINTRLVESKGHLDHPEDLVFISGEQGAREAISAIESTIKTPDTITLKFDGYPALIFGRGPNGKFTIMDKHMFNKKDGSGRKIYSPQEFMQYDTSRGVDRSDLHSVIAKIWDGLASDDRGSNGYYWGDLLFNAPLVEHNGVFKFRPNPNGIAYTVDVKSDIGKLLTGKDAAIAVHQFIAADAVSTDQAVSLDGSIGNLKNSSNVAIVPSKLPFTPKLKLNTGLKRIAEQVLQQYGSAVNDLMNTAPQSRSAFSQLFTVYINKKVVSGSLTNLARDFMDYVEARPMTTQMKAKISEHLNKNKSGIIGAFKIWAALYNLKMDLVKQLDIAAEHSPIKGALQNGKQSHEGFVAHGMKFISRLDFARQNLTKQ